MVTFHILKSFDELVLFVNQHELREDTWDGFVSFAHHFSTNYQDSPGVRHLGYTAKIPCIEVSLDSSYSRKPRALFEPIVECEEGILTYDEAMMKTELPNAEQIQAMTSEIINSESYESYSHQKRLPKTVGFDGPGLKEISLPNSIALFTELSVGSGL